MSVYDLTLICFDDKKEFYENLDSLVKSTPASDNLIVLGDFKTRIGSDY